MQTSEHIPEILIQPPGQLPVIEEMVAFMEKNNFNNLIHLLQYTAEELLDMEGFGYRCLICLYQLLENHGCENLLKEC